MASLKHPTLLDYAKRFWDWLLPPPRPLPVPVQRTPEELARFNRECEDAYLRASGEGHCERHGQFNGEATSCCIHHKILARRTPVQP